MQRYPDYAVGHAPCVPPCTKDHRARRPQLWLTVEVMRFEERGTALIGLLRAQRKHVFFDTMGRLYHSGHRMVIVETWRLQ